MSCGCTLFFDLSFSVGMSALHVLSRGGKGVSAQADQG
jgi:hypothetical protein